jgi:hypothetical protein
MRVIRASPEEGVCFLQFSEVGGLASILKET